MTGTPKPKAPKAPKASRPKPDSEAVKAVTVTLKMPTPYLEAIGRRKRAIARVRAASATKTNFVVNGRSIEQYFGTPPLIAIASAPLTREGFSGKYVVSALVSGGGSHAQAEAIRLGLSRILVKEDASQKGALKKLGFLKRDSRKVERKHFGLRKARKRKQWKKR